MLRYTYCCRFVNGLNLYQYSDWRNSSDFDLDAEGKMLTVAVQLTEASSLSCQLVLCLLVACCGHRLAVSFFEVLSLLQTLSELHSAIIAHLDVKGDNIMLTQNFDRPWDTVRLIDFAMASKSNPGMLHS